VHRPIGEQHQDRGADVAATAPSAVAAPSSTTRARTEAEPEAETAGPKTPAEAGPEWPVVADVVAPDIVTEFAAGLLAMLVEGAPCLRVETEAQRPGSSWEWRVNLGKWVVHRFVSFLEG
jgi:hypothetical protein